MISWLPVRKCLRLCCGGEKGAQPWGLVPVLAAAGPQYGIEIGNCRGKDIVHDQVFIPGRFLDLVACCSKSARQLFGCFRVAVLQALPEDFQRRRENENSMGPGKGAPDLASSLDVDIQKDVVTRCEPVCHLPAVSAVIFPMHLSPFKKTSGFNAG